MDAEVEGFLVGGVVASVRGPFEGGRLARVALEAHAGASALDLVERKIEPASWCPVAGCAELLDLAWELEARRDPAEMRERGRAWARKIHESGLDGSSSTPTPRRSSAAATRRCGTAA